MARPTKNETTARVIKAFKKIGFGGQYASYDVIDKAPFIELLKHGSVPDVCFQILDQADLDARASHLVQSTKASVIEINRSLIGEDVYVGCRLVHNMHVKLYAAVPTAHAYLDTHTKSIILKYGTVIIEVMSKKNYVIDLPSAGMFEYLEKVSSVLDECVGVTTAIPYTVFNKLYIYIPATDYTVETEITVEEFNSLWND